MIESRSARVVAVEARPASAATDVFAFGVLLYELLTARRAFSGPNILHVLSQVRACDPEVFAGEVGKPFDTLLRQMLVPNPQQRTISMQDIGGVLSEKDGVEHRDAGQPAPRADH